MVNGLISALLSNLGQVDRVCEEETAFKILALHGQTRIFGGRLHVPSIQEAAQVLTLLIHNKENKVLDELETSLKSIPYLCAEDLNSVLGFVNNIFTESKYIERLELFKDGVRRNAQRYGIASIEPRLGSDIVSVAYRVGIKNAIQTALVNVEARTKFFIASRSSKMGLESLMTDKVSVLKKNGEQHDNISASVQAGKIFINRSDILIETGDRITRNMSNGGKETFEVVDPGFHEKFHGIPAGYQMQVKKLGIPESGAVIQNTTFHLVGDNMRINNNSVDNSINIAMSATVLEKMSELRKEIESSLQSDQKKGALEVVDAIEEQFKSGKPSKPVVDVLLSGLPQVGNIATIISAIQGFF